MRELQLVGYTADLLHLVFTDTAEGGARFKAAIDEDFVATLTEVIELVDPESVPLGALVAGLGDPGTRTDAAAVGEADAEERGEAEGEEPRYDERSAPEPEPAVLRGVGPLAGMAAAQRPIRSDDGEAEATVERSRPSKLAPREIQALLRAGQGPRSVAKQADTDEQWVRRWLPPIEAEREQVLQAVWSSFVAKARLGVSADPVGEAVDRNLAAKGVHEDDPTREWIVSRREGDAHWRVVLRYRSRGRAQRALWNFDPETGELDPRNDLAVEIAWTRPGQAAVPEEKRTPTRRARRSPSASKGGRGGKKRSGKKTSGQKKAGKKASQKKSSAKKTSGKKAPAKKTSGKKSSAKKAPGKTASPKKSSAKKASAAKSSTKKAPGKKAPAKKSSATKSSVKKSSAKKAPAKKAPAKKAPAKKSSASKASPPPGPSPQ